jgi:hypothetical protein
MAKRGRKYKEALRLLDEGYKTIQGLERELVALLQHAKDADGEYNGGEIPGAALRGAEIHEAFVSLRKAYLATAGVVLGGGILCGPFYRSSTEE